MAVVTLPNNTGVNYGCVKLAKVESICPAACLNEFRTTCSVGPTTQFIKPLNSSLADEIHLD